MSAEQRPSLERELEASQRLLATTLESIGDAVIATDAAGHVTFMNAVAERLTGWKLTAARGKSANEIFHIVHEQTRATVPSPVDQVLRDRVVVGLDSDTVLIAQGGAELAIDDSAAPIRNEQGELTGVVLVFRDVTQKRKEDRRRQFLLEAGRLLASSLDYGKTLDAVARLAVPHIADWCAIELGDDPLTSKQVAVAHVDPKKLASALALGERYPPDRHAPHGVPQVLRTGAPEMFSDIPEALLLAGARDDEHRRLIRELGLRSYMAVPLIARGRTLGCITFVAAESGQRYAQGDLELAQQLATSAALAIDNARLHQQEAGLRVDAETALRQEREIAESIPQQVWTSTPDGALDFVNRRVTDYFGKSHAEVLGAGWQGVIHPDDLPMCIERWTASLKSGDEYEVEFRLRRGDGVYRWHLGRALPLRQGGAIAKWFGTNTDIDERKKAIDELQRRAEFEKQLIGIVSHDLRNPLSAILASATMILRRDSSDERASKGLRRIINSGENAERMIRDLLDFTQARLGGGIPIAPQAVNFHATVQRVADELAVSHPERVLKFEHSGDAEGTWDPDRVAQVVGNLLGNALRHGPPEQPVRISSRAQGEEVVLEIHNGGEPIPPELVPVLFEPLSRGTAQIDRNARSIGLGLFIVKQIVDAHRGSVQVSSTAAEGTRFTVRLPRRR